MSGARALRHAHARARSASSRSSPGTRASTRCGPTVYAPQHIGNLRPVPVRRPAEARAARRRAARHPRDQHHRRRPPRPSDADAGEDKMERAARAAGRRPRRSPPTTPSSGCATAAASTASSPRCSARPPSTSPSRSSWRSALEAKGYTYRIDDGLYFDTSKFPRYAEFARLDLAGQAAGARIGDVAGKRQPADFALWKFAAPGVQRQQEWDSPWGRGFPGWHLECSAMSIRYLGTHFDIHTGGVDHIARAPHQRDRAERVRLRRAPLGRASGCTTSSSTSAARRCRSRRAHVWCSTTWSTRGFEPLAYRYFFLQAHYRQQQTFIDEAMEAAATGYRRLLRAPLAVRDAAGERAAPSARRRGPARALPGRRARRPERAARARGRVGGGAQRALAGRAPRAAARVRRAGSASGSRPRRRASDARESDPRIDALVAERQAARAGARLRARPTASATQLDAEGIEIEDTRDGSALEARVSTRREPTPRAEPGRFQLVSEFTPQGDQPRAIERAGRGPRARRRAPDAARRHRQRQDLHDRLRRRAS